MRSMPLISAVRDVQTAAALHASLQREPSCLLEADPAHGSPLAGQALEALLGAALAGDAAAAFTTTPDGGILGAVLAAAPDTVREIVPGWDLPASVTGPELNVEVCLLSLWTAASHRRRDLATAMLAFLRPAWLGASVLACVPRSADLAAARGVLEPFGFEALPDEPRQLYVPALTSRKGLNHLVALNR